MIIKRITKWADINMAELDLEKLIIHFAQSNKAEGKSPKTISWYSDMLDDFVRFLQMRGINTILAEFNANNVREFIVHKQCKSLSPYTVQGKVRALKAFSSWLFNEGYTPDSMLSNVKLPKVPIKFVETLTQAEIEALIAIQNPLTAVGCRDIAILITLLDTGLRCSELSNLHFENSHIDEGYLKVNGKGSKERLVPIGGITQKVLWRYIIHFRSNTNAEEEDYLFLTLNGKHLQTNAIKLILKRWGKRAGVPRLHPHLCRHTYATNYLLHKCGDVFRLQHILGHNTLEMVRRYVHYASSQAMMNSKTASPIDQLGMKKLKGYKVDQTLRRNHNHVIEK
ncbi:tyrosine-type recombinase/integrase [Chloroflexota bacterium]